MIQTTLVVLRNWRWMVAAATCKTCGDPWAAGHICFPRSKG